MRFRGSAFGANVGSARDVVGENPPIRSVEFVPDRGVTRIHKVAPSVVGCMLVLGRTSLWVTEAHRSPQAHPNRVGLSVSGASLHGTS